MYFNVYIILDFPITYKNASALCQSEYTCLHKTVKMAVSFVKSNENTYPKGRALMQMYRVIPITKRANCWKVKHSLNGLHLPSCHFSQQSDSVFFLGNLNF